MADGTPATGRDGPAPELVAALGAALLEASWQEGLIVCDPQWRLVYATPAAEALLGLEPGLAGRTLWRAQPALAGGLTELRFQSAMAAREAVDAVAAVKDVTGGGPDYAFEAIGSERAIQEAWRATRAGGTVVVEGTPETVAATSQSHTGRFLAPVLARG